MTEISKEWCINMAKQEEGDIGAGKLAIDPTADNFQNLPLNGSFERAAIVAEERAAFNAGIEAAAKALEEDAKLCDCAALEERECGCGAWCEWKSITSARAVELVRALQELG